jgi:uncharacterized protein (TIGR03083 family)
MPFDGCLEVLAESGAELAARAGAAGLDARVSTCPEWTVADLVAHQGMVHRWAAGNLRLDETPVPDEAEILRSVPAEQLLRWFVDGVRALLDTLRTVDPDVPARVFLRDAPPPRHFWARRQAHETTVHAVDALAAALGRVPTASEAAVDPDVAVDGVDELLTGFFPRGRSKLAAGEAGTEPVSVAVVPSDSERRWTFTVADGRLSTERTRRDDAGTVLSGTAAELYLGLWNRGAEITESGQPVLDRWRDVQHVTWA